MSALLSITLAACSATAGDEPVAAVGQPLQFGVMATTDLPVGTRASAGEVSAEDIKHIGVWAWRTVASGPDMVMIHDDNTAFEAIRQSADLWRYEMTTTVGSNIYIQPLKHWDVNAQQYDFVAYTPFRNPDAPEGSPTAPMVNFDRDTRTFSISEIKGNIPVSSPDYIKWMHAHTRRTMATPPADYDMLLSATDPMTQTLAHNTDKVPLMMHYLTPVVEIRAYTTDGVDLTATEFSLELTNNYGTVPRLVYTKGSYTSGADDTTPTWTFDGDATISTLYELTEGSATIKNLTTLELADRRNKSTLLAELSELPQDISTYFAKVHVTTSDGDNLNGIIPMQSGWASNIRYIYYIMISNDNDYIVMDVDVDVIPWIKGDDVVIEPPIIDW